MFKGLKAQEVSPSPLGAKKTEKLSPLEWEENQRSGILEVKQRKLFKRVKSHFKCWW